MPRTRYRWDEVEQRLIEVGGDYVPPGRFQISMDTHYEGLVMADGTTVVNSRRQHKEYLKRTGKALAADFKGVWEKTAKDREKFRAGDFDRKERREALGRAAYEKGLL